MLPRGLVLVTGPTGSGKSTSLAAMINHINEHKPVHIITIEDPIEFMHTDKVAAVNQREVEMDTHTFADALRHVMRQNPDVILVGEMRDNETMQLAITAAETGHLVFSTVHTTDAAQTIDRIVDVFEPERQEQIRMQLAVTLQAVISMTLHAPHRQAVGRIAAFEIMIATAAIRNMIREREDPPDLRRHPDRRRPGDADAGQPPAASSTGTASSASRWRCPSRRTPPSSRPGRGAGRKPRGVAARPAPGGGVRETASSPRPRASTADRSTICCTQRSARDASDIHIKAEIAAAVPHLRGAHPHRPAAALRGRGAAALVLTCSPP